MIKVSVIVPVYNGEAHLNACLDSLINQTLDNIEIIVVNDGSTDLTQTIIETYQQKHQAKMKVFAKPNVGIADTRNFGLSKVTGKYFTFLDSDDTAHPMMLESMFNQAQQDQAQLVCSDFEWVYPHKTRYSSDGPYTSKKDLLVRMYATLWNKLYLTSWIQSLPIQFPTGYRYEDASFLYKVIPYLKTWSYVPKPFVRYYQRAGSITHHHNERVKDMLYVFTDLLVFYRQHKLYEEYFAELEYLFIRFFLGNSFLRTLQIPDRAMRNQTLNESIFLIEHNFPKWKRNIYINEVKSMKHLYFKIINKTNYKFIATLLRPIVLIQAKTSHRTFK
jgi:glycosyltransferase involved in cell wall biosynthesis